MPFARALYYNNYCYILYTIAAVGVLAGYGEFMTELPLKQDILRNRDVFFRRMLRIFLLFLALLGGACIGYLLFLVANAHVGNEVRFLYPRLFSDFTQAAYYSVHRDAYLLEGGASYSAIALIFMLPFALIFRKDLLAAEYSAAWAGPNMQILASSWRFWVAFALYQAVVWSVLYLLFCRLTAKSDAGKLLACFASSAGAVYTLIRGNTLLIALVLVLLFLVLNGSERAWKRELGLICFAAAGAFKLYPLFFGAVLLHEKRWGAAARSVLYFLALYFLPVLFYSGGFGAYLGNLFVFIGGENHLADRSNIAIASQLYKLFRFVFSLWGGTVPAWAEGVCIAAGVLFLFFAAAAAIVTDDPLRRSVLALCAVTLVPPVSYFYVTVFAILPAAEYLNTYERRSARENRCFTAVFAALGFYPIYACRLFAVSFAVLFALGAVTIVRTFRDGEFGRYCLRFSEREGREKRLMRDKNA